MVSTSSSITRQGVMALAMLSLIYFLENFDRSLISVAPIPYISSDSYNYSLLTGTLFAIVYTFGGLVFSVVEVFNSSRVLCIAIATLVFSLATFATAFATNFLQQALLRVIMGLGQSIVTPFSSGILSGHFTSRYRGIAFAVYNIGTYLSFSLALSLGTYLYDEYGWQSNYLLFGLIGIAVGLLSLCTVTDPASSKDATDTSLLDASKSRSSHSSDSSHISHRYTLLTPQVSVPLSRIYDAWSVPPYVMVLLCVATGVRIGAGYIWVAYTSPFFSPLYISNDDSCMYSYNATIASDCSSSYPYCIGGECKAVSDYPWQNRGMSHHRLEMFMSWIPLVGSGVGNLLGGYVTDLLSVRLPLVSRPLIAGAGTLLAIPFVYLALSGGYPGCFLYMIASGWLGEMYIGSSLSFISDITVIPSAVVPSIALFMFAVTIIGGNAPLLVPFVLRYGVDKTTYVYYVTAASANPDVTGDVTFSTSQDSSVMLQDTLIWVLCSLYLASAITYFGVTILLRRLPGVSKMNTSCV